MTAAERDQEARRCEELAAQQDRWARQSAAVDGRSVGDFSLTARALRSHALALRATDSLQQQAEAFAERTVCGHAGAARESSKALVIDGWNAAIAALRATETGDADLVAQVRKRFGGTGWSQGPLSLRDALLIQRLADMLDPAFSAAAIERPAQETDAKCPDCGSSERDISEPKCAHAGNSFFIGGPDADDVAQRPAAVPSAVGALLDVLNVAIAKERNVAIDRYRAETDAAFHALRRALRATAPEPVSDAVSALEEARAAHALVRTWLRRNGGYYSSAAEELETALGEAALRASAGKGE